MNKQMKNGRKIFVCVLYVLLIVCVMENNEKMLQKLSDNVFGYKLNKHISTFLLGVTTELSRIKNMDLCRLNYQIAQYINNLALRMMQEAFDLLRNKTYNYEKFGYDTFYLQTDQITLVVVILCLLIHFYMNFIVYFVYLYIFNELEKIMYTKILN